MKKKINLIITAGTSVAVITEMIYVIYTQNLGELSSVKVITTSVGKRLSASLFDFNVRSQTFGAIYTLCDELGLNPSELPFSESDILVPSDKNGIFLEDIRTTQDDFAFANLTNHLVQTACTKTDERVFACQAGGRKSMGSHLMSAMQVYARKEDHVFHILVNEPFELASDFYYPTKSSKKVHHFTTKTVIGDSKDAKIDLIDIPFLRLRVYLEESTLIDFMQPYSIVLRQTESFLSAQKQVGLKEVWIDLSNNQIYVTKKDNEHAIKLTPKSFALFCYCAYLAKFDRENSIINFGSLLNGNDRLKNRLLLHYFYFISRGSEIEEDRYFDIEISGVDRKAYFWSKDKTDLKNELENGLYNIESKKKNRVLVEDIWVHDNSGKKRNRITAECWCRVASENIHFINFEQALNKLSSYVRQEFLFGTFSRRSNSSSIFSKVDIKDLTRIAVTVQTEINETLWT